MLSTLFVKNVNTVRLALQTLANFNMIDLTADGLIAITNWEKHQNIEGMEKIREQNRLRKQRQRQKQQLLPDVTGQSRDSHATDIDKEEDKDKEYKKILSDKSDVIFYQEVIQYLNEKADTKFRSTGTKTKKLIKARYSEGFSIDDFKTVIDKKTSEWLGTDMSKYLRPETLFGTKFESYLNQTNVAKKSFKSGKQPRNEKLPDWARDDYDYRKAEERMRKELLTQDGELPTFDYDDELPF